MPVTVQFSGDESQLSAAMNKIIAQQERMERGFHRTSKAAGGIEGYLTGQVKEIGAMAAAYLTVDTLMSSILGKVKEKEEIEAKGAARALGQVEPQRAFLHALGAKTAAEQEAGLKWVRAQAETSKIPINAAYGEAQLGLKLTGGDQAQTQEMMRLAAQIEPGSTEERKAFMEGAINIRKMKGVESDKEAMALIHEVVEAGGIIEPAAMVKQFSIAMASAKGVTAVQAGGLIAALSQASGDRTGRGAGEALGKITTGLEELLPEKDRAIYKEGRQVGRRKGTDLTDFDQRIAHISSLPQAKQEAIISQLGLEGKFAEGFRQVITGAPGVAGETYRKFTAAAPGFTDEFDKSIALTNRPFTQKFGAADRGLTAMKEGLANTPAGRAQAIAGMLNFKDLQETLGMSGQTGVGSILTDLSQQAEWYAKEGKHPEVYGGLLKSRIGKLREIAATPDVPDLGGRFIGARQPKAGEREAATATADYMEKAMPDLLQKITDLLEETKKGNAIAEKAQATLSPAAVQENRNQHGENGRLSFWEAGLGFGASSR
jgi:hypothetical protein